MKACGIVVEYNPLHNGHVYHIQASKQLTGADCVIAVMSGPFLQRGEPALIDKFSRARSALQSGVDIVIELPYPFAVQSSEWFAKGAIFSLNELGIESLCFGSESGNIQPFIDRYELQKKHQQSYDFYVKSFIDKGLSYPKAHMEAAKQIQGKEKKLDLSQPNNILGFQYLKTVLDHQLPIELHTIQRTNHFHDERMSTELASATSIRKHLFKHQKITDKLRSTMPPSSIEQLSAYYERAGQWHHWEHYFPLLLYKVMTMDEKELANIKGVDEGLEYRIKKKAQHATSFNEWVRAIKTKRYTWTRIQRLFVHILTNTKKTEIDAIIAQPQPIHAIKVLGFTKTGRRYLNQVKKQMNVPIYSNWENDQIAWQLIDEKANHAYYSILNTRQKQFLIHQNLQPPIMIE